jgi:sorting nexin-4
VRKRSRIQVIFNIKRLDPETIKQEDYTNRFSSQITFIRKHFKTIQQNLDEVGTVTSDLGTLYNGWSLNEEKLAKTVEYVGEALDLTTEATKALSLSSQESLGKLLKEYEQYCVAIGKVLKIRRRKYAEYESLSETLVNKQNTLGKLESSEHESQRISAVISSEGASGGYVPPAGVQRSSGLLATINSLIDNDPETSRRRNISKTKDRITTIEEQKEALNLELIAATEVIKKELENFQRQKVRDSRNAFLAFAIGQRDYHQKALAAWKEARGIIEKESV